MGQIQTKYSSYLQNQWLAFAFDIRSLFSMCLTVYLQCLPVCTNTFAHGGTIRSISVKSESLTFSAFFFDLLSTFARKVQKSVIFEVKNNVKANHSDFTEIDLIVPPWANVFVQTGRHYRQTVRHIDNNDRISKTKGSHWFYRYDIHI